MIQKHQLGTQMPVKRREEPIPSLQATFDPPPTFASAKVHVAANAPEPRRWAASVDQVPGHIGILVPRTCHGLRG